MFGKKPEKMKDLVAQNFHDSTQYKSCHTADYRKFKCKLYTQDSNDHSYLGQRVTGLERRKKETKNKRRRRKRIFNLTPKVPNMESIPEDEEIENSRQNPDMNPYSKSRRRDSICSMNSSGQESDSEQVESGGDKPLPDYLCLGDEVGTMDDSYCYRFAPDFLSPSFP
jgi:hypothetical protein